MADSITRKWARSKADEVAVRDGCHFDLKAAERVREFFAKFLRHSKGTFAGKPFELQPWQWEEVVGPAYGWKRPDGTRRYRRVSVWISKKNGKSTLCSGVVLYGLVADGEPGAEVYGAAADRIQAGIIFEEVAAMVDQSPALASRLTVNRSLKRVTYDGRHSFYQVLSKESRKTGHGINASTCVKDEVHVVGRELYETLRYAGAARRQPLDFDISTAGNDKTSLGYERYCYAKQVLKGEIEDPELLPCVYEADANDAWEDPAQWKKANPSLGITISLDGFKADFREAKNGSPATQSNFKQLRLNLWQDAVSAWLPVEEWDACQGDITPEMLAFRPCWGGLDLASKMDLCAWLRLWELEDGRYACLARFWAPEEADARRARANLAKLKPWASAGHITLTPGNVTDYDVIEQEVLRDCEADGVREVAFDPWNATQLATHLQEAGVRVVEFPQTIRNFNEPMKELEKLVRSRRLVHDGNPVLRWMLKNVSARQDPSGNVRPDRASSSDKIDGVVALIMALARGTVPAEGAGESDYSEVTSI